jgi:hypothetical protein
MLRVTGPNLGEAFLLIEKGDNGLWKAGLRLAAAGPDVAATAAEAATEKQAWDAGFELYRLHVIG